MSETIMGQIGEYRELSLEELRAEFGQQCRDIRALELARQTKERLKELLEAKKEKAQSIAEMFAEVLGNLEAAICYLGQVNEQYDMEEHIDDVRLVTEYGLRPCNPAVDFWLQADLAEGALKVILDKLQRVEPLAPKEEEA